jgi:voltage-gated potassium channel
MMRHPGTAATLGVPVMTSSEGQQIAPTGGKAPKASRPHILERRVTRLMQKPPSIRAAAAVIVTATTAVVIGGGILIRVLDHSEYSNIWVGMWWSLQTVTTVGYGDVTPRHPIGRLVGAVVMLEGIAFLAIITAVITSTFVARAERERQLADQAEDLALRVRLEARLDELDDRFDTLEGMIRELGKG